QAVTIHAHGCAGVLLPAVHGTAGGPLLPRRAGPLQGRAPGGGRAARGRLWGAAPGAELYAADVFCARPSGGAVDEVAEAFAWLVHEQVPVINVSLVGPANRTLESVVASAVTRGYLLVPAGG